MKRHYGMACDKNQGEALNILLTLAVLIYEPWLNISTNKKGGASRTAPLPSNPFKCLTE